MTHALAAALHRRHFEPAIGKISKLLRNLGRNFI